MFCTLTDPSRVIPSTAATSVDAGTVVTLACASGYGIVDSAFASQTVACMSHTDGDTRSAMWSSDIVPCKGGYI